MKRRRSPEAKLLAAVRPHLDRLSDEQIAEKITASRRTQATLRGGRRKESEIVREILRYLQTVPGVVAWRNNTGALAGEYQGRRRFVRFGFPGLSDIIGWRRVGDPHGEYCPTCATGLYPHARFLAIEVKRPGGRLSVAQEAFGAAVERAGGLFLHAQSVLDVVDTLTAQIS